MPPTNTLYYGDNLPILRRYISDESVDLIYLDPPFNSNRNYNVLFKDERGKESESQILAFEDTWHWNDATEYAYQEILTQVGGEVGTMISAMSQFIGTNQMMAYLVMMTVRLVELHRVLKPTGSLYLHCDPTASHYLKVVLDTIFSPQCFRNEITWKRTHAHGDSRRRFANISDTILFYTKSETYNFNPQYIPYSQEYINAYYRQTDEQGRRYQLVSLRSPSPRPNLTYDYKGYKPHPNGWAVSKEKMEQLDREGRLYFPSKIDGAIREKYFLDEMPGVVAGDTWVDIGPISAQAAERLGYPTQKPLALLERIINASSKPGDVVLDPFCGCCKLRFRNQQDSGLKSGTMCGSFSLVIVCSSAHGQRWNRLIDRKDPHQDATFYGTLDHSSAQSQGLEQLPDCRFSGSPPRYRCQGIARAA